MAQRRDGNFYSYRDARKAMIDYYNAGVRDYNQGNFSGATRWWRLATRVSWTDEKFIKHEIGLQQAAIMLGKLAVRQTDYSQARIHFERAYELGSSDALVYLARIALQKNETDKANMLLLKAIREGNRDALDLYKQLIQTKRKNGAF